MPWPWHLALESTPCRGTRGSSDATLGTKRVGLDNPVRKCKAGFFSDVVCSSTDVYQGVYSFLEDGLVFRARFTAVALAEISSLEVGRGLQL